MFQSRKCFKLDEIHANEKRQKVKAVVDDIAYLRDTTGGDILGTCNKSHNSLYTTGS